MKTLHFAVVAIALLACSIPARAQIDVAPLGANGGTFGSGGGGVPSGPAGGDLGGTYPNPTVTGVNGAPLGSGVATALQAAAGGTGGFALQSSLSSYCALSGGAACTFTGVPITTAGSATTPGIGVGIAGTGLYSVSTTGGGWSVNSTSRWDFGITNSAWLTVPEPLNVTGNFLQVAGNISLTTLLGAITLRNGATQISAPATSTLQFGSVDAATAVAQSIFFQNVVAGTSNTAGANATIQGSLSTGSGLSGDIILKTGGTGAAATVQNAANTALTIKGATQQVQLANSLQLASISACTTPTGANGNFCVIRGSSGAGFCTFEVVTTTNTQIIAANVPGGC